MKLVVFDCDGTLIDSQYRIYTNMHAAFAGEGLAPPTRAAVRAITGISLKEAMALLAPDQNDAVWRRLVAGYVAADAVSTQEAAPFEGIEEILAMLHRRDDCVSAIATGMGRRGLDRRLAALDWGKYFVATQTADDAPSKPAPGMVLNICAATGILPGNSMVLGDTSYDMQMATSAGARATGVLWGYHGPEQLTGAEQLCRDMGELHGTLLAFLEDRGAA